MPKKGKHKKCRFDNVRVCPVCGSEQIKVQWVGTNKHGTFRRRRCLDCDHRYNTIEVHMDFLEEVFVDAEN